MAQGRRRRMPEQRVERRLPRSGPRTCPATAGWSGFLSPLLHFRGERLRMRRRDVIVLFGCATATWPFAARTQQQSNGLRRVVCLYSSNEGDPLIAPWMAAFQDGLQKAGWTVGRDLQIENRWAGGIGDKARNAAQDLIALKPDVIVVAGTAIETLLQLVHDVPVVFTIAVDPVGSGFIKRLSHPGGNVTGFMQFDYSLSAKWAELLKQVAPNVKRAGVIRDAATTAWVG